MPTDPLTSVPSMPAGRMDPPLPAVAAARASGDQSVERMATYAIHAAFELEVLSRLERGPCNLAALARELDVHPEALHRLMRTLAALDVVAEDDGLLRPGPMAAFAHGGRIGAPDPDNPLESSWAFLANAVKTGKPAFDVVHGMPLFEYLEEHPAAAQRFHARMHERGEVRDRAVTKTYDFARFRTIVDVGGGTGGLLRQVTVRYPEARGILFDQPAVIAQAQRSLSGETKRRLTLVPGDMFAAVPRGGDAYLLSSILHDWDADTAVQLLNKVRAAMAPEAQLLIVEMVLRDGGGDARLKLLDLEMMAMTGGRERTTAEYSALLSAAGFTLQDETPTASLYSVLRAVPQASDR